MFFNRNFTDYQDKHLSFHKNSFKLWTLLNLKCISSSLFSHFSRNPSIRRLRWNLNSDMFSSLLLLQFLEARSNWDGYCNVSFRHSFPFRNLYLIQRLIRHKDFLSLLNFYSDTQRFHHRRHVNSLLNVILLVRALRFAW